MKIIVHIDMDCYHAQVECKRLNLDPSKPICALQWDCIMAVNYPARQYGITKVMYKQEALKLCKDVLLPHVDTFKIVDGKVKQSTLEDKFKSHSRYEEKISLQHYRDESKLIFNVLRKHFKQIENASPDEGYIELSEDEIMRLDKYEAKVSGKIMTEVGQSQDVENPTAEELLLFRATQWINDVRQEIKDVTQYECSAGISFNKMLAKLASAANKPNGQTLVLQRYLPQCIGTYRIGRIKGFGGKIEQAFQSQGVVSLAQAQTLSQDELVQIFYGDSELAMQLFQKIRGINDENLKLIPDDYKNKSIQSLKNVRFDRNQKHLLGPIIELLIFDVTMRVSNFYEDTGLVPSILNIVHINLHSGQTQKNEPLRLSLPISSFKQSIADLAKSIISHFEESTLYPMIHIGLCARSFLSIKINQPEFKYTLKQFSNKTDEDSKSKKFEEVDQLINPERYYECSECQKTVLKEDESGHLDLHFAMSLDQQVNPNRKRYKLPDQEKLLNQTKKLKPIIEIKSTQSIMSFFKPQKK